MLENYQVGTLTLKNGEKIDGWFKKFSMQSHGLVEVTIKFKTGSQSEDLILREGQFD